MALVSVLFFAILFLAPTAPAQAVQCTDTTCDSSGNPNPPSSGTSQAASNSGLCDPAKIKDYPVPDTEKDRITKSCNCDGTPSLTTDQIKSCEACAKGAESCLKNNGIIKKFIQPIVNFLSAVVAVVIVGSIMFAGIQYALAGDKAEAVGAAKKRIVSSLFAFLVFLLTFAFLQWLIPGGVFKT
ncbi:hypothetical protein HYW35_02260 [Candidatus Saccharibacteria bacterium]|nr:hypothetical protein [Candidatus Saccharibacteria bacterium]